MPHIENAQENVPPVCRSRNACWRRSGIILVRLIRCIDMISIAHEAEASWGEIGEYLGLSTQEAYQAGASARRKRGAGDEETAAP
jgi:hypothetical protein